MATILSNTVTLSLKVSRDGWRGASFSSRMWLPQHAALAKVLERILPLQIPTGQHGLGFPICPGCIVGCPCDLELSPEASHSLGSLFMPPLPRSLP